MTVDQLVPTPSGCEPFRLDRQKLVPATGGCYVLATAARHILYIGLSVNVRVRMGQHLDSPAKTAPTPQGRAVCFHWLETADLGAVERGWLNSHRVATGSLPLLNTLDSPVSS